MAKETKVTLTRAQADALEHELNGGTGWDEEDRKDFILGVHITHPTGWLDEAQALNGLKVSEMARALYEGYDVEKTPKEMVRDYYDRLDKRPFPEAYEDWHEARGIRNTLNLLDIKIEGVNA